MNFPVSSVAHAEEQRCRTSAQEADSAILRARRTDPVTSHQAAANAYRFACSHAGRIVAALDQLGSGTAQEIGEHCGLSVVQVDRRLTELQRAGRALVLHGLNNKPVTRNGYRVWAGV